MMALCPSCIWASTEISGLKLASFTPTTLGISQIFERPCGVMTIPNCGEL